MRIRVLDENDNTPYFGRLHYTIEVPENLEAMPLFTLRANDQDSGESGIINYKITGDFFFTNFLPYFIPEGEFDSGHINNVTIRSYCSSPCRWRFIWRFPLGHTVRCIVHFKTSR